mmetsp:Transcript_70893/g.143587  ORF Transcript_70893/g.143587 Transcript_70893/m.143587 type:complete len:220 (-) Transcript_70893:198-857(-)
MSCSGVSSEDCRKLETSEEKNWNVASSCSTCQSFSFKRPLPARMALTAMKIARAKSWLAKSRRSDAVTSGPLGVHRTRICNGSRSVSAPSGTSKARGAGAERSPATKRAWRNTVELDSGKVGFNNAAREKRCSTSQTSSSFGMTSSASCEAPKLPQQQRTRSKASKVQQRCCMQGISCTGCTGNGFKVDTSTRACSTISAAASASRTQLCWHSSCHGAG